MRSPGLKQTCYLLASAVLALGLLTNGQSAYGQSAGRRTNMGTFRGGSTGGTNGIGGVPVDARGRRTHQLKGYHVFEAKMKLLDNHIPGLAIFLRDKADDLVWYKWPEAPPKLSKEVVGLEIYEDGVLDQIARLKYDESPLVYFNETAEDNLDDNAMGAMILHETILSSFFRLKYLVDHYRGGGNLEELLKKVLYPKLPNILSEFDISAMLHRQTRTLTIMLLNVRENENSARLRRIVKENNFGEWRTKSEQEEWQTGLKRATYAAAKLLEPMCSNRNMQEITGIVPAFVSMTYVPTLQRPLRQIVADLAPAQIEFLSECPKCIAYDVVTAFSKVFAMTEVHFSFSSERNTFYEDVTVNGETYHYSFLETDNRVWPSIITFTTESSEEKTLPALYSAHRTTCRRVSETVRTKGENIDIEKFDLARPIKKDGYSYTPPSGIISEW